VKELHSLRDNAIVATTFHNGKKNANAEGTGLDSNNNNPSESEVGKRSSLSDTTSATTTGKRVCIVDTRGLTLTASSVMNGTHPQVTMSLFGGNSISLSD